MKNQAASAACFFALTLWQKAIYGFESATMR